MKARLEFQNFHDTTDSSATLGWVEWEPHDPPQLRKLVEEGVGAHWWTPLKWDFDGPLTIRVRGLNGPIIAVLSGTAVVRLNNDDEPDGLVIETSTLELC